MVKAIRTIAITGGTGFLGLALTAKLIELGDFHIKILSRKGQNDNKLKQLGSLVEVVVGDLLVQESLKGFLDSDCTLVHLGFIQNGIEKDNLQATNNLILACNDAKIKRLIHISTVSVFGRTKETEINEETPCNPETIYGVTKFKIEKKIKEILENNIELIILRPTSVFETNRGSLMKLEQNIQAKKTFQNYLKSCLFNERRMNLVHVINVVAAIVFLIEQKPLPSGSVFIVSDDDSANNIFSYVERAIYHKYDIPYYPVANIKIPLFFLSFALRFLGRNNINPKTIYSPQKLLDLGFKRPVSFEKSLNE